MGVALARCPLAGWEAAASFPLSPVLGDELEEEDWDEEEWDDEDDWEDDEWDDEDDEEWDEEEWDEEEWEEDVEELVRRPRRGRDPE
jgi:hypothetical protein